jgi:predicted kinase
MPRIHLLLGPVGAGKSTLAAQLAHEHGAVAFDLDDWMTTLFGDDTRPETGVMGWYVERTQRVTRQIWAVASAILDTGADVVLELGLVQRRARADFLRRVDDSGHELRIYVLDAPRDERRRRVERRNAEQGATFSMVVPSAVFELASDLWEPLDADERRGRDVLFLGPGDPSDA